jgi:hypothetical protein
LASTALLLVLLCATTIAFAITEGLKLEPSPITTVAVDKIFSPTCECGRNEARIRFGLRKADTLTVSIVDARGAVVRTLLGPAHARRGFVTLSWDGRDDGGRVVRDGVYRPQVHMRIAHRTIVLPNPMQVDTKPPTVTIVKVHPTVVAEGHRLSVRYRVSEPAHASIVLDGKAVVIGHASDLKDKLDWYAKSRPGVYRLTLVARDLVGNLSRPTRGVSIRIPIRIVVRRVVTRVGGTVRVRIETDGRAYYWKLGGRSGLAITPVLSVPAPGAPGSYALIVREHGDQVTVRVIVRAA